MSDIQVSETWKGGWIVEVADCGPWLSKDGKCVDWSERGIWPTEKEAIEAARKSLVESTGL